MSRSQVRINGGIVILEEINERKRVPLDDYMKALAHEMGTDSGLIAPGVRYTKTKPNGYRYLLVEEAPIIRTINYSGQFWDSQNNHEQPKVPLPWLVYWIRFNQLNYVDLIYPAVALKSIDSLEQPLYRPCLPNIYHNTTRFNYACLGNTMRDHPREPKDVLAAWWASSFNDDLGWHMPAFVPSQEQIQAESPRLHGYQRQSRAVLRLWAAKDLDEVPNPALYGSPIIGTVKELINLG